MSDDETAEHFRASACAGGFMREYLLHGQLLVVLGDTLYTHGGIMGGPYRQGFGTDCLGYVPGCEEREPDVHAWVRKLNAWCQDQIAEWIASPHWDETRTKRGGAELMDYVVPGCQPSVVLSKHLDKKGMPADVPLPLIERLNVHAAAASASSKLASMPEAPLPPPRLPMAMYRIRCPVVVARLTCWQACGVQRLVIGHIPHGNCPTVIKCGRSSADEACLEVHAAAPPVSSAPIPTGV